MGEGTLSRDTKTTLGAAAAVTATLITATLMISSWFTGVDYQLRSMNEKMERFATAQTSSVSKREVEVYFRELQLLNPELETPDFDW